jgi:hypothetical protein
MCKCVLFSFCLGFFLVGESGEQKVLEKKRKDSKEVRLSLTERGKEKRRAVERGRRGFDEQTFRENHLL